MKREIEMKEIGKLQQFIYELYNRILKNFGVAWYILARAGKCLREDFVIDTEGIVINKASIKKGNYNKKKTNHKQMSSNKW